MAEVVIIIKIMPSSPQADLEQIKEKAIFLQ
jgi:translation elongation factor EF-1beta